MDISIPRSDYYTYLYRRNGIPFYVGKGRGNRLDAHLDCARKNETCKHLTCRVIRKEWRDNGEITREKICEDVSEQASFRVERLMISIGMASGWPLVNQTIGGEGVSGYRHTEEQRANRKAIAQQLVAEGRYEHLKIVNKGRKHTPEVEKKRAQRITEVWSDPDLQEWQRQRMKDKWEDPAFQEKRRQALADPDVRKRCGAANIGNTRKAKTYPGFVSPLGVTFAPVENLAFFCEQHDLQKSGMCLVAQGKQLSHKGWTRYEPEIHPVQGLLFDSE